MAQIFRPPRKNGFILHFGALMLNLGIVGALILLALGQQQRINFILYLIIGAVLFLPSPFIAYRLFALLRSSYTVDREGISFQWGIREVVLPMADIEWIRFAGDLAVALPLPPASLPGAVLGLRFHHDLGHIEYIASDASNLLLIASHSNIYAISPDDPRGFQEAVLRNMEMGSISPITAKSSKADFLIGAILNDKIARLFILLGFLFSVVLLVASSIVIPQRESISLGFNPFGMEAERSPSERLLLLPVLTMLFFVVDIFLGSYLYRKKGLRIASYLTFAAAIIMPLSFIGIILVVVLPT